MEDIERAKDLIIETIRRNMSPARVGKNQYIEYGIKNKDFIYL